MEKTVHGEIYLGFPEKPQKGDFDYENFPSKIGGKPVWLYPPHDLDLNFFKCECKRDLFFLLQIYSPLEEFQHTFHRVIYVFFCHFCWKKSNAVKVLRMQLPENSDFYQGSELKDKSLFDNEFLEKLNSSMRLLGEEFTIITDKETNDAKRIYFHFYDRIDEKSKKSRSNSVNFNPEDIDIDVDDLVPEMDNNKVNDMINTYLKDEGITVDQIEVEDEDDDKEGNNPYDDILKINEDIFFECFSKVVNYDPKQIIRYSREEMFPLWFNKKNMITIRNTKCKYCKGEMVYEFQIMPYIFNMYKEIMNIDIGTIVIYSCKNSCSNEKYALEYGYIQRSGEKLIELEDLKVIEDIKPQNEVDEKALQEDLNKLKIKGNSNNEIDEDGFIQIKKKGKKKD